MISLEIQVISQYKINNMDVIISNHKIMLQINNSNSQVNYSLIYFIDPNQYVGIETLQQQTYSAATYQPDL